MTKYTPEEIHVLKKQQARDYEKARMHRRCCGGSNVNCPYSYPNLAERILQIHDLKLDSHASPQLTSYGPLLIDSIVEALQEMIPPINP